MTAGVFSWPFSQVVQITDCHLLATPDALYQGIRPYQYLQRLLDALRAQAPLLVLTGDLTEDHSPASYGLLQQLLAGWPAPVFLLPGNHDERTALDKLSRVKPCRPERRLQLPGWQLWLLDSKGDTPAGSFPAERLAELEQWLGETSNQPIFWFCHHHLLPIGSFIDRFDQQDKAGLLALLEREPRLRGLAHGHCHHAYQIIQEKFVQVGCPASSVQFLQTPDWQTEDQGPRACRWTFHPNGELQWEFLAF
jgi:Icc protein